MWRQLIGSDHVLIIRTTSRASLLRYSEQSKSLADRFGSAIAVSR